MGNKQSKPPPEQVYDAAKAGNINELKELAVHLQQIPPGDGASERRRELLEWRDERGRTPLIVAASKNNRECVELLLQHGANVQAQSGEKDGGSALHCAIYKECSKEIVENLLRFGASPFVENAGQLTSLDFAMKRKNSALVKRLTSCGFYADYLKVKVTSMMGLNSKWAHKWVVVLPRYPDPRLPPSQQSIRRLLFIYKDAHQCDPSLKVYLDGSNARVMESRDSQQEQDCVLTLHNSHSEPKGGVSVGGSSRSGYELYFRAASSNDTAALGKFISVVNQRSPGTQGSVGSPFPPADALEGQPQTDEEMAAELSRALNGGAAVGTSASQYSPMNIPASAPEQFGMGTAPSRSSLNRHDSSENTEPSAPPVMPSAPMMDPGEYGYVPNAHMHSMGYHAEDSSRSDSGQDLCAICLDKKKNAGFMIGNSVHVSCCMDCANWIMEKGDRRCPITRQQVDRVVKLFS